LERWWWQLFWQLRRQCMPVVVMGVVMADMVDMLPEDMPRAVTLGADMLVSVLAMDVLTILRGPLADRRALQGAHIIGMAAVTGEAVTGIRPPDIRWAITAWATAIHPTELGITVIPTVDTMVRTTDTILTATDTGRP
jgi:hypothetical protein